MDWEPEETDAFVQSALARAGRKERLFDSEAIARLHELAGGVPRRVGRLAELALIAGAGRGLPSIDRETVESVHEELGVC